MQLSKLRLTRLKTCLTLGSMAGWHQEMSGKLPVGLAETGPAATKTSNFAKSCKIHPFLGTLSGNS